MIRYLITPFACHCVVCKILRLRLRDFRSIHLQLYKTQHIKSPDNIAPCIHSFYFSS